MQQFLKRVIKIKTAREKQQRNKIKKQVGFEGNCKI
jgi:hypothetical protein